MSVEDEVVAIDRIVGGILSMQGQFPVVSWTLNEGTCSCP